MANLSDILAKLATLIPEDSGEAKALIAEAKREAQNQYDDLKSANAESAGRKTKIRELQAELDSKQDFTETEKSLKAEIDALKKVKAEFDGYKAAEDAKVIQAWTEKAKVFETKPEDKLHDKIQAIRGDFFWAEEGKTLTATEAKNNLDKFGLLEKAGALSVPDSHTPNATPPSPNTPTPQPQTSGAVLWKQTQKK